MPGASYGTWEWDLVTDESTWSDELYAILGLSPETSLAGVGAYATALHPDDISRIAVEIDRVRRSGAQIDLEHRVHTHEHMRFVRLRAWRSGDGRHIHAIVEDQTSKSLVSDRLTSVSTFAAGIAHEINNSLGFVSANLELLAAEQVTDPQMLLREARHGIQRIHTVVRGLMTFSKTEPTHDELIDLNQIVEVALAIVHREIRLRAKLVRQFDPLPPVEANAARLGQVVVNLLTNAAQAIPPGTAIDHQITVATSVDDTNRVIVEVRDTGRGIPRSVGAAVFDELYTTKAAGQGLGLSVCRNVVHAIGGEITFESDPGNTVFRIVLPSTERLATPLAPLDPARRGTVLIVDDEVMFANSLRRLLSREHDVAVAHDGVEALARLRLGERYDAIVSDFMMPGLGGIELYNRVEGLTMDQAQRFIFLSAGCAGAAAFLERVTNPWFDKPCDLDALRAAIRRLVG